MSNGSITKSQAAAKGWTYGLGDHIMKLRRKYDIETIMNTNPKTGSRYATYKYIGPKN
tara:strand:+ start:203 stop:376 length:174 start_codon:yes stop_codon:yes gene_type:complete